MSPAKPFLLWTTRRNRLQSIGVSVIDTTPEIRIALVIVTANSRNSRPRMPLMKRTGMNTAASDTVIDTIVNPISFEPFSAASNGRSPCSMWRTMFSERRRSVVEKREYHRDHEDQRDEHRHLNVLERLADVPGAIAADRQVHGGRQLRLKRRQESADRVGDRDGVAARLAHHRQADRAASALPLV